MPLHSVCPASEIPPGARKLVTIGRIEIGIFNVDGAYHAYRNICPHAGAPVCVGGVSGTTLPSPVYEYNYGRQGHILRCPWHGWEFDLKTGEHLVDPDTRLKSFPVEIGSGRATGESSAPASASASTDCARQTATACAHAGENLEKFPVEINDGRLFIRLPG